MLFRSMIRVGGFGGDGAAGDGEVDPHGGKLSLPRRAGEDDGGLVGLVARSFDHVVLGEGQEHEIGRAVITDGVAVGVDVGEDDIAKFID